MPTSLPKTSSSSSLITADGGHIHQPARNASAFRAHGTQTGQESRINNDSEPGPSSKIIADSEWLSLIDILVLNEHELAEMTGSDFLRADQALPLLQSLHRAGDFIHHRDARSRRGISSL